MIGIQALPRLQNWQKDSGRSWVGAKSHDLPISWVRADGKQRKRDSRDTEWTGCRHSWRSTSTKRKLLETWFSATIPPQSVVWRKRHRFSWWLGRAAIVQIQQEVQSRFDFWILFGCPDSQLEFSQGSHWERQLETHCPVAPTVRPWEFLSQPFRCLLLLWGVRLG